MTTRRSFQLLLGTVLAFVTLAGPGLSQPGTPPAYTVKVDGLSCPF